MPVNADSSTFAGYAVAAGDNYGREFAVIDKVAATVSVYDAIGKLLAVSPVLLGQSKGDMTVAGIGERLIQDIKPHERTTPAGRFVTEPGINLKGEIIVWLDYDARVSMHRLRPANAVEKRPERMASPSPLDNRITYGCINVPVLFYEKWLLPTLGKRVGVIYILPEVDPAKKHFAFLK